jgi:hypothetical protein
MTRERSTPDIGERRAVTLPPAIEILVLCADERGIRRLRPRGDGEFRVDGGSPADHPTRAVRLAVEALDLTPRFVHSTSWRYEDGRVVLTYVAVVDPPLGPVDGLENQAVVPADLARSGALEPPASITTDQVLQHTLHHLTWLVEEDPAARRALGTWLPFLAGHRAEPFRAFDGARGTHGDDELVPEAGRG